VNIFNRYYRARFAPSSSDWRAAIYNGVEVVDDGLWKESFADGAFLTPAKPVPVVLGHNEAKVVGEVVARTTDGGWHIADFTLDHSRALSAVALDLLRIGTPVSIGARSLRHDKLLAEDGVKRHTIATLDEISILGPGETPAYRGAQITHVLPFRQPEPKAKPTPTPNVVRHSAVPVARRIRPRDETDELRRRMDWLGPDVPVELILENMHRELRAMRRRR
jgi:hypothetical protein